MKPGSESVLVDKVRAAFREKIISTEVDRGEVSHLVDKGALRSVCTFLKTDPELRMNFLSDIAGVDYPDRSPRFEVVYQLYSIPRKHRIRIRVRVADGESVPSVTSIWAGADWAEREVYDMFGLTFDDHPNLKRIYMAQDWEGWPLRKDYPLRGYKDRYNPYGVDREDKD